MDKGKYCVVDYIKGEKDPYYNGDDTHIDSGTQGNHTVGNIINSTMVDAPDRSSDFDDLNKTLGGKLKKYYIEFETCVFCAEGKDAGKYYGCIQWKYELTDNKGPGTSTKTGTTATPTKKTTDAVDEFSKNNKFKLPK